MAHVNRKSFLRVITVSLETMKIVHGLPKLEIKRSAKFPRLSAQRSHSLFGSRLSRTGQPCTTGWKTCGTLCA